MKIKELRKKHNLNQTEFAKIAGVSQRCISSYENEETYPDMETLKKIANHFHVTIDELVGNEVQYQLNKFDFTEKQLELIEIIKKLSESNCNLVKAYLIGLLTAEEEKQNIIKKFTKGE